MKARFLTVFIVLCLFLAPAFAKKKQSPVLILSEDNPAEFSNFGEIDTDRYVFLTNHRIYFAIYNPQGFKTSYIKYQLVKQDDNAHVGGFTRCKNETLRVSDKNFFSDYFLLTQPGKYYLQVFDITDLQHWLAIVFFRVVDE